MFYALYKELVGYSLVRCLTCGVVVHAKINGVDTGIFFHHLPQHLISHTAGGGVAVAAPIFLVQRNKGQHIYRCFKKIDSVASSDPVKTVSRIAAVHVSFEGTLRAFSALVSVDGNAFRILAHEHGVVVVCRFVDQSGIKKDV